MKDPPEDVSTRLMLEESREVWYAISDRFEDIADCPAHVVVVDSESELTEDGRKLIQAVAQVLGSDIAGLLEPTFLYSRPIVPLLWFASFIIENEPGNKDHALEWLQMYSGRMTPPHELYRRVWAQPERVQDILRATAYINPISPELLIEFCSRLREEPTETIQDAVQALIHVDDLLEGEENRLFLGGSDASLQMLDGLQSFVLSPENFSAPTKRRYLNALLQGISPDSKPGERAAIMAWHLGEQESSLVMELRKRLQSFSLGDAGPVFLFTAVVALPDDVDPDKLQMLCHRMLEVSPVRTKVTWGGSLIRAAELYRIMGLDDLALACERRCAFLLEKEWADRGEEWEKAGVAIANLYEEAEDWESALPWHERIAERSEEHRGTAKWKMVICLVRLERRDEAEALAGAEDALVEAVAAVAQIHESHGDIANALRWWRLATDKDRDPNQLMGYVKALAVIGDWHSLEHQCLIEEIQQKLEPLIDIGDRTALRRYAWTKLV